MIYLNWVIKMQTTKDMFKVKENLKENFDTKLKNDIFKKLVDSLKVDQNILYKHTSSLEDSCTEITNCSKCKGLESCENELKGYCKMPIKDNYDISFNYRPCRYMEKELENNDYKKHLNLFNMPQQIKDAKMKDIFADDKSRLPVIKFIDNYYKNYGEKQKGLYLHGNFGTGKTYLISALFNELAKKGIESAIIYYPDFLRELKSSFQTTSSEDTTFTDKYKYIKNIELLLIDDIGAENVTAWGRDEILGTILQYRMNENKATFFTSNLSLKELESHLSLTAKEEDKIKARRIIERIKCLTEQIEVIGKNRR